jgi:protein tyrosine phosphatase (PTP) superfamily phosphohydrolase (DUF442 family)
MFDFDAIDDTLIVGSAFSTDDVPLLGELGIRAVVNLQEEASDPIDALASLDIAYAQVACKDFHAPSVVQIDTAVAAIREFVAEERRVYLHCRAGLQRSVTIAACYLVASDVSRWNARSALDEVCAKRRRACPMRDQIDALLTYDRYVRALRA